MARIFKSWEVTWDQPGFDAALEQQRAVLAPTVARVAALGEALGDLAETRRQLAGEMSSEAVQIVSTGDLGE